MIGDALDILVIGASYGLLPAAKAALAGHRVTVVGHAREAADIAAKGLRIDLGPAGVLNLGQGVAVIGPEAAEPDRADLVILAVQEPLLGHASLRSLMKRLAAAKVPLVSIMNHPPLSFMERLMGAAASGLASAYAVPDLWSDFDPLLVTHSSPDAQALRPDPSDLGLLRVPLPTNFKIAPFGDRGAQDRLSMLCESIDGVRLGGRRAPVRLVAHPAVHVPLAKWPMLITGNYRAITDGDARSIDAAVWADPARAREIYDAVSGILIGLGVPAQVMVPFDAYAAAARSLTKPSAVARALAAGAPQVERVDLLVRIIAQKERQAIPELDDIVARVDRKLLANRARAGSNAP